MPFTLSHAVLAPPIAKLSGGRLPIGALAIGCMVPDLYRLLVKKEILLNHQWHGIFHPDLWVGLLFCFLWYGLYRPMIFQAIGISNPLKLHSLTAILKFFIRLVIAVLIGTATHIIWDGLTHLDFRTFAFRDFLAQPVTLFQHVYPMHNVLQIGCSFLALPFLIWMAIHYILTYKQHHPVSNRMKIFSVLVICASCLAGIVYYFYQIKLTGLIPQKMNLYSYMGFLIKTFTQGALDCFSAFACLFLILKYKHYFK